MMNNYTIMKVEVVLRESIKPSCPTPPHLASFDLSFLDQLAPPVYVPLLLFYANDDATDYTNNIDIESISSRHRCDVIKKSLAETLTRFYPFAGRIKDDRFVECNDNGVDYLQARVHNIRLSQLIQQPQDHELVKKFLPFDPYGGSEHEISDVNLKVLLAIQVNVFEDCGGMVIGLCISHKMADASSLTTFINDWASTAHGATDEQIKGPDFVLPSLFPPRDLMGFMPPTLITREEVIVTKKFVFGASKIAELKKKSLSMPTNNINESDDVVHHDQEYRPTTTRVEAVSALIWRCFIDVDQAKEEGDAGIRAYALTHAVNMRTRMVRPLPTNSIGNMHGTAVAMSVVNGEGEKDKYPNLVSKVKDAIKKIDGNHVRELQTTNAHLDSMKQMGESISSGQVVMIHFSSWCRFPLYESDFGWGKPICVSTCKLPSKNLVLLMDTSSGDGIEAWVSLTEEDMVEFESDEELLAFVS